MLIPIPEVTENAEFVFDLEPAVRGLERRTFDIGTRASRNRMALYGIHVARDVAPAIAPPCELPWNDVVYSVVTARLGFLPDRGSKFVHARVEIGLGGTIRAQAARPIAFALIPSQSADEVKQTTTLEVIANIGAKVSAIEVNPAKRTETTKVEVTTLRYRVLTFGEGSSEPAWDFRVNEAVPELAGDFALAFITATPAGVSASGALQVLAEVESGGLRIPLLSKRPDPIAASATFQLTGL